MIDLIAIHIYINIILIIFLNDYFRLVMRDNALYIKIMIFVGWLICASVVLPIDIYNKMRNK